MSPEFLTAKAREICYALVKVAFYIKRNELRQRLEGSAFDLLQNTAEAVIDAEEKILLKRVFRNIAATDALVKVGHSLYEIEPVNANVLSRELEAFNSAIRQFGNLSEEQPSDLTSIQSLFSPFPKLGFATVANAKELIPVKPQSAMAEENNENGNGNGNGSGNGINMAIRQSAVINRIKQGNGNGCRLKDLLAEFPDVSERTLRYDLQRLCEQGVIQRIGNGGPASFYQFRA